MELTEIVYDKSYWEIRFDDIDEWWVLGIRCGSCGHQAPVDLKRRSGEAYVRFATKFTRCTKCGNGHLNRLYVAGKHLNAVVGFSLSHERSLGRSSRLLSQRASRVSATWP